MCVLVFFFSPIKIPPFLEVHIIICYPILSFQIWIREKIVLSMFPSSDYLSFSQISEKSHYVIKTNFFILSQLTIFSPTDLSHDMKQPYCKLKMFHHYPLQKKLRKGFFAFSGEHCAPPIGVKYPLYYSK